MPFSKSAPHASYNSRHRRSRSPTHQSMKNLAPGALVFLGERATCLVQQLASPLEIDNAPVDERSGGPGARGEPAEPIGMTQVGRMKTLTPLRQQTGRQMTAEISQVVMHPRSPPARSRPHDFRRTTAHPLHPQPSMMGRVPVHQLAKFLPVERTPPRWPQLVNIDGGGTGGGGRMNRNSADMFGFELAKYLPSPVIVRGPTPEYDHEKNLHDVRHCHCYAAHAMHNLQGQRNGMLARAWPPATEGARRHPDMRRSPRLAVTQATHCARRGLRKLTSSIPSCLHMILT